MRVSNLFGVEIKHFRSNQTLRLRNKLLSLDRPMIMAVINTTPDSFHPQSRVKNLDELEKIAQKCMDLGVRIVDLGAHSTRPGYVSINAEEQINRLDPCIDLIKRKFPELYISIDTSLPEVAQYTLSKGADLINDVEGGRNHPKIYEVCAQFNAPYVLVHSRGPSNNLHEPTEYKEITSEVILELSIQLHRIKAAGVKDIIVDLGFGFSKSIEENFQLVRDISMFELLGFPLLYGFSRKSMIHKKLNTSVEKSLNGTTILNTYAILKNATFLRVHDLDAANEILELLKIE